MGSAIADTGRMAVAARQPSHPPLPAGEALDTLASAAHPPAMSADLQALFDRVVASALAAEEQDEHDALRLELLAHELFRAAPRRGQDRFAWAVVPLTASSGEIAWVALTERARLPLPVVIVEGVFADEAEAIAAAREA